ncbi:MAG: metallophosphoesterase [Planctomycetota bacterium]|jgi:hypothetical protein
MPARFRSFIAVVTSCLSTLAAAAGLDEAPHLFHQADGSVLARWIVDGAVHEQAFEAGAAIRLPAYADLLGDELVTAPHAPDPAVLPMPERVFVLSDVEGEYEALVAMLRAGGVIDPAGRWCYGEGHLVSVGDMVDRGEQVTEVLWLMYRLEREAEAAGGRVHFVLGNHETMYMGDDVRYTAEKYARAASLLGVSTTGLVGPDTEIGRWLRSRNSMVRLGDVLFVHAGVSVATTIGSADIDAVNTAVRTVLGAPKSERGESLAWALAWGRTGPMWYRGYFPEYADDYGPVPTPADVQAILAWASAKTIVVGHSQVDRITPMLDGAVLAIDIPWTDPAEARAVVFENGAVRQCGLDGAVAPIAGGPIRAAAGANEYVVTAPPAAMDLDPFYAKFVSASGYPIVSSERVDDYALMEAAFLIDMMLAKRPDVREAMIESGSRMVVMAHDEYTTDLPEQREMTPKDFWDVRARGLGGSRTDELCSSAEENLLAYEGDPYSTENILIHEFAHNIHLRGMVNVDPTFDTRLIAAYEKALEAGLWHGKYASTNHAEYFAEGVQSWFDDNREPDHDHNHVNTRAELLAYDPGLAALCKEVFGDTVLVYTKPQTRLHGHLAGYDPLTAPTFKWPERLQEAREELRAKAQARTGDRRKTYVK